MHRPPTSLLLLAALLLLPIATAEAQKRGRLAPGLTPAAPDRTALQSFLQTRTRLRLQPEAHFEIDVPLRLEGLHGDVRAVEVTCMATWADGTKHRAPFAGFGSSGPIDIPASGTLTRDVAIPVRLVQRAELTDVAGYDCTMQLVQRDGTACIPTADAKDAACRAASGSLATGADAFVLVQGRL